MADISDVTRYLAQAVASAIYPDGTSSPSVAGMDVRIFEGWPLPQQLDLDMAGKMLAGAPPLPVPRPNGVAASVSVFPMMGATSTPFQVLDNTYVIALPNYGMSVSVAGSVISVSGEPYQGEYLTIIVDTTATGQGGKVYSRTGPTTAAILAALLADALVDYPTATGSSASITLPYKLSLIVRLGGIGTLGRVTHRQQQAVMITTWAPNHETRATIAAAIDNVLKRDLVVELPDSTQMRVRYSRTNVTDEYSLATIYRRDLIYDCEYATLWEFPGYVITSVHQIVTGVGVSGSVATIS